LKTKRKLEALPTDSFPIRGIPVTVSRRQQRVSEMKSLSAIKDFNPMTENNKGDKLCSFFKKTLFNLFPSFLLLSVTEHQLFTLHYFQVVKQGCLIFLGITYQNRKNIPQNVPKVDHTISQMAKKL
jgi:hypothetical protein